MQNYQAALCGNTPTPVKRSRHQKDALAWAVDRYKESSAFLKLKESTRTQRMRFLGEIAAVDLPYTDITTKDIKAALEKRAGKPSIADHFMKSARGFFKWLHDADMIDEDPTANVKAPRYKTDGHHVWTEEEVTQFEACWPVGTRERLALAIFLYTGLRVGDVCRLGRQHVKDGVISIKTAKTGAWVYLPIMPQLQEIIDATTTGNLTFIANEKNGAPMTANYLGHWFGEACDNAGVPGSAHGLRKAGATRLAEAGATLHELNAVFGWSGSEMAGLYTAQANRRSLAESAMAKLKANKE